jgi:hypothetical protein
MKEHAVWKAEPLAAPWPGWKIMVGDVLFLLEAPYVYGDWPHSLRPWVGTWCDSEGVSGRCQGDSLVEALVAFQSYPNAEVAKMVDATFRDVATLWSISQNTGKEYRIAT